MILPEVRTKNVCVPETNLSTHPYLRVEIGLFLRPEMEKVTDKIQLEYEKLGFVSQKSNVSSWEKYFKKTTVLDYFINNNVSVSDINRFFSYCEDSKETVRKDGQVFRIAEQQKRAIDIFILSCHYQKITIKTMGMYLNVLYLTYLILKDFIVKGGNCVEITYPHFNSEDELVEVVTKKVKAVKLGEMTIR